MVKQALNYERSKEDTRVTMNCVTKKHKEKIEEYLKENENIWNISRFKLKLAINQYFNHLWVEQTPLYVKAGTYKLFKNRVGIEDYLVDITNRRHKVIYTKSRLSDHSLMIEEGRRKRPKIPRDERICLLCTEEVEHEIYFLIKCPSKSTERNLLFTEISKTVPSFSCLDPTSKFIFLMSQENKVINKLLIEQTYRWSTVRHRTNI